MHILIHDKIKNFTKFSNPITSLIINFVYLILIIPSFIFLEDNNFCFYYFNFLFIFYLITYFFIRKKLDNANCNIEWRQRYKS